MNFINILTTGVIGKLIAPEIDSRIEDPFLPNLKHIDTSESYGDTLSDFLDNCQGKQFFIIADLSRLDADNKTLKSILDLTEKYQYKVVLILADYNRSNDKAIFSTLKEFKRIDLFSTKEMKFDLYALSDIWIKKYLDIKSEPKIAAPNIYSNNEVLEFISDIINCYANNNQGEIKKHIQDMWNRKNIITNTV